MEPIYTHTLCIRPFKKDDCESFVEAVNESASSVGVWLEWCHEDYLLSEAETWFDICRQNMLAGSAYECGIFSKGSRRFFGSIGINHINREHNYANVGYWIRHTEQGNGIASQAVTAIAHYGFCELKLTRLEIVAAVDNIASRRVAEKSGAVFECIARNRLMVQRNHHDAAVYSLIPEQFGL